MDIHWHKERNSDGKIKRVLWKIQQSSLADDSVPKRPGFHSLGPWGRLEFSRPFPHPDPPGIGKRQDPCTNRTSTTCRPWDKGHAWRSPPWRSLYKDKVCSDNSRMMFPSGKSILQLLTVSGTACHSKHFSPLKLISYSTKTFSSQGASLKAANSGK